MKNGASKQDKQQTSALFAPPSRTSRKSLNHPHHLQHIPIHSPASAELCNPCLTMLRSSLHGRAERNLFTIENRNLLREHSAHMTSRRRQLSFVLPLLNEIKICDVLRVFNTHDDRIHPWVQSHILLKSVRSVQHHTHLWNAPWSSLFTEKHLFARQLHLDTCASVPDLPSMSIYRERSHPWPWHHHPAG
jgi:hypothetical protein